LSARKAAALDHIDHLIERRTASTANDVADGMRAVKRLAIECDVPVLLVSHMNRSEEKGLLARLLDGGAKERDADVVMFLRPMQREGGEWKLVTNEQAQVARGRGEPVAVALDVFKNREGPSGRVMLTWLPGGRVAQMAREER
jgi:replicative DNA helicase